MDEEDAAEGVGGVGHQVREKAALLAITFISLSENCPDEVHPEDEVYQQDQDKTLSYGVESPTIFQGGASRAVQTIKQFSFKDFTCSLVSLVY